MTAEVDPRGHRRTYRYDAESRITRMMAAGQAWYSATTPPGGWPPGATPRRGELHLNGLTWLRNRAYDPGTRAFLSPDPLPLVPGTPTAANPYHYADNNPLNLLDPLGLRPMTDADLSAYRQAHGQGWLEKAGDWAGDTSARSATALLMWSG